jgi:hypothetical protein
VSGSGIDIYNNSILGGTTGAALRVNSDDLTTYVYGNTIVADDVITAPSGNFYFYDNVVNSSGAVYNDSTTFFNLSTVGNTWTTPSADGYSDTCLTEDGLVCYTPYTIGSSTDYYPVALSAPTAQGITVLSCPSVFPNEDNLPSAAKFNLSFSVLNFGEFATATIDNKLKIPGLTVNGDETTCSFTEHSSINRTYECNVTMNYWYDAGDYDANITFTEGVDTYNVEEVDFCTYGQLLASAKTLSAIAFSDAAPGITDSQSDSAVTVRNTGNVDFDLFLTAYDLEGRSTPSIKLPASTFKAGASLGTAVTLANSVSSDLSMTIEADNGAEDDIWFWLSMPTTQAIQDYYAPTAWTVTSS